MRFVSFRFIPIHSGIVIITQLIDVLLSSHKVTDLYKDKQNERSVLMKMSLRRTNNDERRVAYEKVNLLSLTIWIECWTNSEQNIFSLTIIWCLNKNRTCMQPHWTKDSIKNSFQKGGNFSIQNHSHVLRNQPVTLPKMKNEFLEPENELY